MSRRSTRLAIATLAAPVTALSLLGSAGPASADAASRGDHPAPSRS